MNTPSFCLAATLLAALLAAAPAGAQTYTLRTSVVPALAGDASGSGYTLRSTVDYVAGLSTHRGRVLGTGFWYQATGLAAAPRSALAEALPPLAVVLTTAGATAEPGDTLPFTAAFAVGPEGPEAFELWAEVTLPDGRVVGPLAGPSTALVAAGAPAVLAFQQRVPASAAPGTYTYTVHAGTYPNAVLATHAVPFSVAAPAAARPRLGAAARATRTLGTRAAATDAPSGTALNDGWLAYDGAGRPLGPGTVIDLRSAADETGTKGAASAAAGAELPSEVALAPAYPNPARGRAVLRFGLPAAGPVRLVVYDTLGREVAVALDAEREAGWHEAPFDGGALASGLYVVRLEVGGRALTRRLALVR